jgi:uncharacterized DUF497 family protein
MDYTFTQELEWDATKSARCEQQRGFNFEYAARALLDPNKLIREDKRFNYGEQRFQIIGKINTRVFVVIYAKRDQIIRIISARKANKREVNRYENRKIQAQPG